MLSKLPPKFIYFNGIAWILILLTWALYEKVDHYTDISGELLQNHSFDSGVSKWDLSRNLVINQDKTIDLSHKEITEKHSIRQTLPKPRSGFVRVSADAQLIDVVSGPNPWQQARVDILGRRAGGNWHWNFSNILFSEAGTMKIKSVSAVIRIPEEYSEILVRAELTGTGVFFVERMSLKEVQPRLLPKLLTFVLLGCWILLGLITVWMLTISKLWLPSVMILLVGSLLLVIPELLKQEVLDVFASATLNLNLPDFSPDHLLLFFVASLFVFRTTEKLGINCYSVMGSLITFSFASEVLQYYTSHRVPGLVDSVTNIIGILIAFFVLRIVRIGLQKRLNKTTDHRG